MGDCNFRISHYQHTCNANSSAQIMHTAHLSAQEGHLLQPQGLVVGSQVAPEVGTQVAPGVGSQVAPGVGTQVAPGVGSQVAPGVGTQAALGVGSQVAPEEVPGQPS